MLDAPCAQTAAVCGNLLPVSEVWWTARLGIFQARSHVCVALAARGMRNLDRAAEPQPAAELEAAELEALRREARRVHVRSLLTALLLTLLTIAVP